MTESHRINLSRVWVLAEPDVESRDRRDLSDLVRCEAGSELSRRFNQPSGVETDSSVTIQLQNFPDQAEFFLNGAPVTAAGDHRQRSLTVADRLEPSNLLVVRLTATTEFCQPISAWLEIAQR